MVEILVIIKEDSKHTAGNKNLPILPSFKWRKRYTRFVEII